jgi:hypothetical protein
MTTPCVQHRSFSLHKMTFRPPRLRKSRSTQYPSPASTQTSSGSPHLFSVRTTPRTRRERDTSQYGLQVLQPIFALPGGNDYTHHLPGNRARSASTRRQSPTVEDDVFMNSTLDINVPDRTGLSAQQKKERQRQTWVEVVIPALIQPYLKLMHVSQNFRGTDRLVDECTCNGPQSQLTVICVFFQRKRSQPYYHGALG